MAKKYKDITFYDKEDKVKVLRPLNRKQKEYITSIENNIISFGIGSAGVGKSFVAVSLAATMLQDGRIEKLIITRPIVEAGEELGFLPGTEEEKTMPYLAPILDILNERLGKSFTQYLFKSGKIEFRPLAYLRGTSFKNTFIIADEFQNTTPKQMKMFLTRIGENCKVVIDGDIDQKDIPGISGLEDALDKLKNVSNIGITYFTIDDCVRSGIVKDILFAYEKSKILM